MGSKALKHKLGRGLETSLEWGYEVLQVGFLWTTLTVWSIWCIWDSRKFRWIGLVMVTGTKQGWQQQQQNQGNDSCQFHDARRDRGGCDWKQGNRAEWWSLARGSEGLNRNSKAILGTERRGQFTRIRKTRERAAFFQGVLGLWHLHYRLLLLKRWAKGEFSNKRSKVMITVGLLEEALSFAFPIKKPSWAQHDGSVG